MALCGKYNTGYAACLKNAVNFLESLGLFSYAGLQM
jgi:NAD(P)H-dependent FMN reductase